jgi:hypothetical protein
LLRYIVRHIHQAMNPENWNPNTSATPARRPPSLPRRGPRDQKNRLRIDHTRRSPHTVFTVLRLLQDKTYIAPVLQVPSIGAKLCEVWIDCATRYDGRTSQTELCDNRFPDAVSLPPQERLG